VAQVAETVSLSNIVSPLLKLRRVNLHGCSAFATGEVMVVNVDVTASIEALASVRHHYVNLATFNKFL
jgi:hypothetical protein